MSFTPMFAKLLCICASVNFDAVVERPTNLFLFLNWFIENLAGPKRHTDSPDTIIHETEIKMVKSKWSYKKFMVEIRNRNELRGSGSKRITRVETDYEGRNELRGSKQITRVETNYEGRNELRNYMSIREII